MKTRFYAIVFLLSFFSCEEVVDLTIPSSQSRLVIEGGVFGYADELPHVQTVKLSTSVAFFNETNYEPITNATVSVNDGTDVFVFTHVENGRYTSSPFSPAVGKTYTINIVHDGIIYSSSSVMPSPVVIDGMYFEYKDLREDPFADGNLTGYQMQIDYRDPAGIVNYYLKKILVNGNETYVNDPGNRFNAIATDEYFDGETLVQVKVNDEYLSQPNDEVVVQLFNISLEQYNYYNSLFTLTSGGSLLGDPPPARLIGNVKNLTEPKLYPLGFFQVAALDEKLLVVPD